MPNGARELHVESGQVYEDVNLFVESIWRVAGRVVDHQGRPASGATVIAPSQAEIEKEEHRFVGIGGSYASVATGPNGRFVIDRYDDLPVCVQAAGNWRLRCDFLQYS